MGRRLRWCVLAVVLAVTGAGCARDARSVLTFSGSVVGREGEILAGQIARFRERHPSWPVEIRATPDAADHRHQLYVQWLNARAAAPDVLQLDVVWAAEFAAAGWIADLTPCDPPTREFFAAAIEAGRWQGAIYALPWFIDVGMLYRRVDLAADPPPTLAALREQARAASRQGVPFGLLWQGARYEGLVTVFLEHLGAFGGRILDAHGAVAVDSEAAVRALAFMRDALYADAFVPPAVLTWQEEQTRLAFQNGQAVFMRNWPYAFALLQDEARSRVAGRVAVSAMPRADGGVETAALGGSSLAINAYSDQREAAYALVTFLLDPEQMLERARVTGQFPSRPALYDDPRLAGALAVPPADARAVIDRAIARPATPVYSELSEILQVALHRALTRQQEPRAALQEAAAGMRAVLARARLAPAGS